MNLSTDTLIRPLAGGPRNGLPVRTRNYVYRGRDVDTLTPDRDGLRVQVRRYLTAHPMLTALEVAVALDLPEGTGTDSVRRHLASMKRDGEAQRHEVPRGPGGQRRAAKWTAT